MPKQSRADQFIAAILDIGYVQNHHARSHYKEFFPGAGVCGFLSRTATSSKDTAAHRILVGPRAIRYTLGTVAQSRPVPARLVEQVLDSVLSVRLVGL
jgi:hypothetical protein